MESGSNLRRLYRVQGIFMNGKTLSLGLLAIAVTMTVVPVTDAARPVPQVLSIHSDSRALAAIIFPLKEQFETSTGIRLTSITEMEPASALEELDQGKCDGLIVSTSFDYLIRTSDQTGTERRNKALTQHLPLRDEITYRVIVNPQNRITRLNEKQLRKIFSGSYKNWEEMDGPNLPVSVVWGTWSTGAAWVLADRVMHEETLLLERFPADSIQDIVAKVASSPDAIGIVPQSALDGTVKALEAPELKIKGPFILVTVSFPSPMLLKLIKFIRENPQNSIGY